MDNQVPLLKAPFPWFGGKSRVADLVWDHLGNVPNYVEPFMGSLAVLLGRPHKPGIETVNDLDCFLSNFWRALQCEPDAVATWADWPVNEADLEARHLWLVNQSDFRERMKSDPDFYDVKIAGWWVWGISSWIGGGWCRGRQFADGKLCHPTRPHLGNAGMGINRRLPYLGSSMGINRQLQGDNIAAYFTALANRLRKVRVCCGDWKRVLTPTPTWQNGVTGVFLDPPYASERAQVYREDSYKVAHDVGKWAAEHGDNPLLKIALCGYEGEHEMPENWVKVAWKANGGYGLQGKGNSRGKENSGKERIWFSPACKVPRQQSFSEMMNG